MRILFLLILIVNSTFSQTHLIKGVVFYDKETPLESANIIAKPIQEKAVRLIVYARKTSPTKHLFIVNNMLNRQ